MTLCYKKKYLNAVVSVWATYSISGYENINATTVKVRRRSKKKGSPKRDHQKGITKKGLPKRNWNHRKGSLKRDCQKEIGITAKRDCQKGIAKKKNWNHRKSLFSLAKNSSLTGLWFLLRRNAFHSRELISSCGGYEDPDYETRGGAVGPCPTSRLPFLRAGSVEQDCASGGDETRPTDVGSVCLTTDESRAYG